MMGCGMMGTCCPMASPYIVQPRVLILPSSHMAWTISQHPSKDLSDDPHRLLSNSNDQLTGSNQTPVIAFHLHQTYCYYFDVSHTPYKSFPQMITLLLTTHFPFVLPLFHFHHASATHSFLSHFPYLLPLCFSLRRSDTKSMRGACPKPLPLYSGSVLLVFPQTLSIQESHEPTVAIGISNHTPELTPTSPLVPFCLYIFHLYFYPARVLLFGPESPDASRRDHI